MDIRYLFSDSGDALLDVSVINVHGRMETAPHQYQRKTYFSPLCLLGPCCVTWLSGSGGRILKPIGITNRPWLDVQLMPGNP